MDNLLGSDSNILEKCHLLESGLSYQGDLCQVNLQQNGDENSESVPGKEINEGQNEVHLNTSS